MRDETDLSGLKITIDLKRGTDPDKLMQKLFRLTPLEDNFSCNFNVLVGGMPKVMGVGELLERVDRLPGGLRQAGASTSTSPRRKRSSICSGVWKKSCWTLTRPSALSGRPKRSGKWFPT